MFLCNTLLINSKRVQSFLFCTHKAVDNFQKNKLAGPAYFIRFICVICLQISKCEACKIDKIQRKRKLSFTTH